MAKLLDQSDLSTLAEALVEYFPESLMVFSIVKNTVAGILDRDIWVDSWPRFTALVTTPSENSELASFAVERYTAFKTPDSDDTGLRSLLRHGDVMDWSLRFNVLCNSKATKDIITAEAEHGNCTAIQLSAGDLMTATPDTLIDISIKLPVGIEESPLKPEDAPFVASKWPFTSRLEDTTEYIRFIITNFPSVSLRRVDDSSVLIGWAAVHSFGALAMFYVEPEFRGHGLGKYLSQRIAKTVMDKGRPVFLHVGSDNIVARQLYLKSGFCQTHDELKLVTCAPKTNNLCLN